MIQDQYVKIPEVVDKRLPDEAFHVLAFTKEIPNPDALGTVSWKIA